MGPAWRDSVLDCGSTLPLLKYQHAQGKRQRTGAVQNLAAVSTVHGAPLLLRRCSHVMSRVGTRCCASGPTGRSALPGSWKEISGVTVSGSGRCSRAWAVSGRTRIVIGCAEGNFRDLFTWTPSGEVLHEASTAIAPVPGPRCLNRFLRRMLLCRISGS